MDELLENRTPDLDDGTTAPPPPAPPPPPPPAVNGSAPLGFNLDGSPKKTRAGRPRKGTPGAPPKKSTRRTPRPAATPTGPDYRSSIIGLLQLPAGALTAAGMVNPILALDGLTIAIHAPTVAEALNDLAQSNPAVAAALDYVLQVGPYGAIIAAIIPMIAQILVNHGTIPAGIMGTLSPETLQATAAAHFGMAA